MLLYLHPGHGHPGHGDDARSLQSLRVSRDRLDRDLWACSACSERPAALSATFKYLMATVLASTFFLIGTALLYSATGMLNIDDLIAHRDAIAGPIGFAALIFLLACLLLELKPFPANGWGLDVYETARSGVAALISVGVSAGVFFALLKLLAALRRSTRIDRPVGRGDVPVLQPDRACGRPKRSACSAIPRSARWAADPLRWPCCIAMDARAAILLVVGGLFVNHLFAKVGLFWLAGYVGREQLEEWSILAEGRPCDLVVRHSDCCDFRPAAISRLLGEMAIWSSMLASGERYVWIVVMLVGSLLEAAYMFRWFGHVASTAANRLNAAGRRANLVPVVGVAFSARGQRVYRCRPGGLRPRLGCFCRSLRDLLVLARSTVAWPGIKCLIGARFCRWPEDIWLIS